MKMIDKLRNYEVRDIEKYDENLSMLQKWRINKRYKKVASRTKMNEAKEKENELELERTKRENKKKLLVLKDNLKEQELNINIKVQETMGKLKLKKAESRCKKIDTLEERGESFNFWKYVFIIISCITSMLGFGMIESGLDAFPLLNSIRHGENLNCVMIGLIFLAMQFCISKFVSSVEDIKNFFKTPTMIPLLGLIGVVYAVSIYSNYGFWITISHSKFVAGFYSFAIDVTSIFLSIYSDKFLSGDNEKIQNFLSENISESVEKSVGKNVVKNVATLEKNSVCDVTKNVGKDTKKTTEKTKRKTVSKVNLTQKEFDKIVENLEEGTRVVPKIFNMTNDRDRFLEFCKNCPHIKKEGNRYYRIEEATKFEVVK